MTITAAGVISPIDVDSQQRIKRIRYGLKEAKTLSKAKIPISWYDIADIAALTKIRFKPIVELH